MSFVHINLSIDIAEPSSCFAASAYSKHFSSLHPRRLALITMNPLTQLRSPLRHGLGIALASALMMSACPAQPDPAPATPRTATIEPPGLLPALAVDPQTEFEPLTSEPRSLARLLAGKKGLVIAMSSTSCPLSNRYAARLAALDQAYSSRGVAFAYVYGVAAESIEDITRHAAEYARKDRSSADRALRLTSALAARTTTEVFLFDDQLALRFRGAIDDQFGIGVQLDAPQHEYLRDAINAILDQREPPISSTWPPGCLLDAPSRPTRARAPLTYHDDIAQVIEARCVSCHRLGGPAPFPLETISDLLGRRTMIASVVREHLMPPWHDEHHVDGSSLWKHDRAMTQNERQTIIDWVESGAPSGAAITITPRDQDAARTWSIGPPDRIFTPTAPLPAEGPLQYARIIAPTGLDNDAWITAIEMRPVKPGTVTHALIWILPKGSPAPAPNAHPTELDLLATYSPGDGTVRFPPGSTRRLPAGASLLCDLTSLPMGAPANATLRIAVRLAAAPTAMQVRSRALALDDLRINPGEPDHRALASFALPSPSRVLALTPVMQRRGRSLTVECMPPGDPARTLIRAPRYDWRWLIRHEFNEPLILPAGTDLIASARYDNSGANPANPDPRAPVRAGPAPSDDCLMLIVETLEDRSPAPGD